VASGKFQLTTVSAKAGTKVWPNALPDAVCGMATAIKYSNSASMSNRKNFDREPRTEHGHCKPSPS